MERASTGGRANWAGAAFELRLGVEFCVYILIGEAAGLEPGAASCVQLQPPEVVDDLILEFETGARWAIQAKAGPSVRVGWHPGRPFGKALRQLYHGAASGQIDLAPNSLDRVELAVDHRANSSVTRFSEWLDQARRHLSWDRFAAASTGQEQDWVRELPVFLETEAGDNLLDFLKHLYIRRASLPDEWRQNLRGLLIGSGVPNSATADRVLDILLARVADVAPYGGQLDAATLHRLCEGIPGIPRRRLAPFVLPQLDVSTFTGREDELEQLKELLLERTGPKVSSIVGLAGTGGIGKSALACHFAELHRADFPDGVIGLRVDDKDVDTIARDFARCCGEEIGPEDERNATIIMQDIFRHRRMLLIFDNADKAAVRSLLPGGGKCAIIVTTRDRSLPISLDIPIEGRVDLPPLPDPDSLCLLERLLGQERIVAEQKAACRIIGLVGNLPLALQIVGATLQMQDWRSLADYTASLSLARLKVRGDQHLDIRASFSLSLELLEPEEVDFFACLSVCAEDGFSIQTAMAAGGCDEPEAQERLAHLYRLSLLNRPHLGIARFVFHPLILLFARELAIERSLEDDAAERHARFFVELVKAGEELDPAAASVIAEELDDIILAAKWLQRQGRGDYEFVIRLEFFFQRHGYWQQAINLMSGFLLLAEGIDDWNAVVQLRIQQAKYLSLCGEWPRALEVLARIADIVIKIEAQTVQQRCKAMWLNTLGGVLQRQGRFDEAADAFQRSLAIFEELGDRRGEAMALTSLGGVLCDLWRFDEAVDAFQRSAVIEQVLGNHRGQAMVLTGLGGALRRLGRFREAEDAFRHSVAIEEQLGNWHGQAKALNGLGEVLRSQGQFDEAASTFRHCLVIAEEMNDQRGQAMVLINLGMLLQQQEQFGKAMEAFHRSAAIEEQLKNRRGLAMVHTAMGEAWLAQGETEKAVVELRQGFEIDESMRNRRGMCIVTPVLVRALLRAGQPDEALAYCQRALVIAPRESRLSELRERILRVVLIQGMVTRIIRHPTRDYLYGFITPDDGGADIYFREGYVDLCGLSEGVRVEVAVEQGPEGPRARGIKVVDQQG